MSTSGSLLNKATGFFDAKGQIWQREPLSFSLYPIRSRDMKPRSTGLIFRHKEGSHMLGLQWKDSRRLDPNGIPGGATAPALDCQTHGVLI